MASVISDYAEVMTMLHFLLGKLTLGNFVAFGCLAATVTGGIFITFMYGPKSRSWRSFWSHVLPPAAFSHPSARADIVFYATKRILKLVWALPAVLAPASIGLLMHDGLVSAFGLPLHASGHTAGWTLVGFTINILISRDLSYYLYHRAQHANPYLWEFHKVHHSAERMVGFTDGRVHPLDDLIYYTFDGIFSGMSYAIWLFFVPDPAVLTLFGVSATLLSSILFLSYLHHLPYKLSLGRFDRVILSPHYHQLHHSVNPIHYDRNFGAILVIWDRMFGTVYEPEPDEDFVYGLRDDEASDYHSAGRLYTLPLLKLAGLGRHDLAKLPALFTMSAQDRNVTRRAK